MLLMPMGPARGVWFRCEDVFREPVVTPLTGEERAAVDPAPRIRTRSPVGGV
jgi:hypothetical protein